MDRRIVILVSFVFISLVQAQDYGERIESQSGTIGGARPIEKYKPQFIRVVKRRLANGTEELPKILVDRRRQAPLPPIPAAQVQLPTELVEDQFTQIPLEQIPPNYQPLYKQLRQAYGLPSDGSPGGQGSAEEEEVSSGPGSVPSKPSKPPTQVEIEVEEPEDEPTNATWTLNAPKGIRFHFSHSHDHKSYKPITSNVQVTWIGVNGSQPTNITWIKEPHHHHHKKSRKPNHHHHGGHGHRRHKHRHHHRDGNKSFNFTFPLWPDTDASGSENVNSSTSFNVTVGGEDGHGPRPNVFAGLLNFVSSGTKFLASAFDGLSKAFNQNQSKVNVQASGSKQVSS